MTEQHIHTQASARPWQFLPGVGHTSRSVFCLIALLLVWLLWLGLVTALGWVNQATQPAEAVLWLLLPSLPAGALDLYLRLAGRAGPQPLDSFGALAPRAHWAARLLAREHGLYWFVRLLCLPWWLWSVGIWAAWLSGRLGWW